jgi:predicted transcriptional regulator
MVTKQMRHVALLSIHPEFADAILAGKKRVEFRKSPFKRDVSHVVLYATAPIGRVVGVFELRGLDEQPPQELWSSYAEVGGIDEERFFSYFAGCTKGVAYHVGVVERFSPPVSLASLRAGMTPPQSYSYLDSSSLRVLEATC